MIHTNNEKANQEKAVWYIHIWVPLITFFKSFFPASQNFIETSKRLLIVLSICSLIMSLLHASPFSLLHFITTQLITKYVYCLFWILYGIKPKTVKIFTSCPNLLSSIKQSHIIKNPPLPCVRLIFVYWGLDYKCLTSE